MCFPAGPRIVHHEHGPLHKSVILTADGTILFYSIAKRIAVRHFCDFAAPRAVPTSHDSRGTLTIFVDRHLRTSKMQKPRVLAGFLVDLHGVILAQNANR